MNKTTAPTASPFPRMLTLDEVQEILNLGKPLVYALVKSGELRPRNSAAGVSGGYVKTSWKPT
jgi:predicted DNA-binding transcriptional regulator AlpA